MVTVPNQKGQVWDSNSFPPGATFGYCLEFLLLIFMLLASFRNQFTALFFKNVVLRRRSYLSCIWQTIFPLIAVSHWTLFALFHLMIAVARRTPGINCCRQ